jgi:hypothetical protein
LVIIQTIASTLTQWEYVNVKKIPPCAVDADIPCAGACYLIKDVGKRDLVASGLKAGLKMTVEQLDQVLAMKEITIEAGSGSGASGNILKVDKATALIKGIFPDDPAEEQQRMVAAVMGTKNFCMAECPETVIDLCCSLDTENSACFSKIAKLAMIHKQSFKKSSGSSSSGGAAASIDSAGTAHDGAAKSWPTITPPDLMPLLPGKNTLPYVYLRLGEGHYLGVYSSYDHSSFSGTVINQSQSLFLRWKSGRLLSEPPIHPAPLSISNIIILLFVSN